MAKGRLFRKKDTGQDIDKTGDDHDTMDGNEESESYGDMVDDDTESDKMRGKMAKGIGPSDDSFIKKFLGKSKNTKKGKLGKSRLNFSKFKKR
jgi:hypothetical protein